MTPQSELWPKYFSTINQIHIKTPAETIDDGRNKSRAKQEGQLEKQEKFA